MYVHNHLTQLYSNNQHPCMLTWRSTNILFSISVMQCKFRCAHANHVLILATQPSLIYYVNDPLWDGAGCVRGSCCQFNSPPWFCKDLPHPTSEDIELRLCSDDQSTDEDVPFELVEIYIQ